MIPEQYRPIRDFPSYSVSNHGNIYNDERGRPVQTSQTNFGHVRVNLKQYGRRFTRSVALLVAEAFCKPPDHRSDSVVILDGFLENTYSWNLVWRPRWFAWKYARQLRTKPRRHYEILPIINVTEDIEYRSVVDCAMREGLLFDDIWESTYSGRLIYPHFNVYQVVK